MLYRDAYRLLIAVARRLSFCSYQGMVGFSSHQGHQDFFFKSTQDAAQLFYLSLPVSIKSGNVEALMAYVDGFAKGGNVREKQPGRWILPVIWQQSTDHALFANNKVAATGFLVFTARKTVQWIGVITAELSQKLGDLLTQHEFTLAGADDCLDLNIAEESLLDDVPQFFQEFLGDLKRCCPSMIRSVLSENLKTVAFYKEKRGEFNLNFLGVSMLDPLRQAVEQREQIDSFDNLTTFWASSGYFLPDTFSMPDGIQVVLNNLKQARVNAKAFCRYAFSSVLYSLLTNNDNALKNDEESVALRGVFSVKTKISGKVRDFLNQGGRQADIAEVLKASIEHASPVRGRFVRKLAFGYDQSLGVSTEDERFFDVYNRNFANFINKYGDVPTITVFVCRIIYEVSYRQLSSGLVEEGSGEQARNSALLTEIEEVLSNVIKAVNDIAVLRFQFYRLYQQFLELISQQQQNQAALANILYYLALLFSKSFSKPELSINIAIDFLNECFFECSDILEECFTYDALLEASDPDTVMIPFFTQVGDPESNLNRAMIFVTDLLGRLPPELSGCNKSLDDYSELEDGASPKDRYQEYLESAEHQERLLVSFRVAQNASNAVSASARSDLADVDLAGEALATEVTVSSSHDESSIAALPRTLQDIATTSIDITDKLNGLRPAPPVVIPGGAALTARVATLSQNPSLGGLLARILFGSLGLVIVATGVLVALSLGHVINPGADLSGLGDLIAPIANYVASNVAMVASLIAPATAATAGVCIVKACKPSLLTRAWNSMTGKKGDEAKLEVQRSQGEDEAMSGPGSTATMSAQLTVRSVDNRVTATVAPAGRAQVGRVHQQPAPYAASEDQKDPSCWSCFSFGRKASA